MASVTVLTRYPQPWRAETLSSSNLFFIVAGEGSLIGSAKLPEAANLFCASADLLVALRNLLPEVKAELEQRQTSGNAEDWEPLAAMVTFAEAALARATAIAIEPATRQPLMAADVPKSDPVTRF